MQKVMHTFLKSQQNSRISAFYSLAVNQDVVGSSPTVGARVRADDESHLLFVLYTAWLLIKMKPANGAEIIQSLSQLR